MRIRNLSLRELAGLVVVAHLCCLVLLSGCGGGGGGGTAVTDTTTEYSIAGNIELPGGTSASVSANLLAALGDGLTARVVDASNVLLAGPVVVATGTGKFLVPKVRPGTKYRLVILTGSGKILLQKFYDTFSGSLLNELVGNQTTAIAILVQYAGGARTGGQIESAVSGKTIDLNPVIAAVDAYLRGWSPIAKTDIYDAVRQGFGDASLTAIIGKVPTSPTTGTSTGTTTGSNSGTSTGTTTGTASSTQYSLAQAMSDNAQLNTIAFSGLAFITGNAGADTFFPPGKVADFFGFQYMRDVDVAGYGHNTTFLSRVANNVLAILTTEQKAKLVALAKVQAPIYVNFAYNRFTIMNAFRRALEGSVPAGSSGLASSAVAAFTGGLYKFDAELSYNRALVVGEVVRSFSDSQKAYLASMSFNNYFTWPDVQEDAAFKKSLSSDKEFVAVMTYASELFSWYKGNIDADVYFCPERHGTYFGGFFMKDYRAMGDPNYFISTEITGDAGAEFIKTLSATQAALITGIVSEQKTALQEIATIRTQVSTELRKALSGGTVDKALVYSLIERYGQLDGQVSALYASRFAAVNKTLSAAQRATLVKLRNLDVTPTGGYRFASPVAMPTIENNDFMFGVGGLPANPGQSTAPAGFGL